MVPLVRQARWRRRAAALYAKYRADTLIPFPMFADNLLLCANVVSRPGAVAECGVWRGGMVAAMAEVLGRNREYYLFDSFEGLPDADPVQDGPWAVQRLAASATHPHGRAVAQAAEATAAMRRAGVTSPRVVKGWFKDTLADFTPSTPLIVLRLDADLYDSTWQSLAALYPHLADGGLLLIDDYYSPWAGCARAVHAYLAQQHLPDRLRQTAAGVAYILKSS